MRVLVDGHHDEVLLEQVHLLRPLPDPVVALLRGGEVGVVLHGVVSGLVLAGRACGEPLVEVGGEDVRLLTHLSALLKLTEL